jgi:hydrogenase maturation protease
MSSAAMTDRPTLVVGLGNPILGDDGVGWKVIDELERRIARDGARSGAVELDRMSVGGLALMERLVGYERAIIVDAVQAPDGLGTIRCLPLQAVATRPGSHLDSAHDASLAEAMEAGRALGARLPDDITVVGIAVQCVDEFDERLSPPVAGAVATAAETIVRLLTAHQERAG